MNDRDRIRQYFQVPECRDLVVEEAVAYICFALTRQDLTRQMMIDEIRNGGKYRLPEAIFHHAMSYLINTEGIVYRYSILDQHGLSFYYGAEDLGNPLFLEFGNLWYNREYSTLFAHSAVN
jgi:hypothetical protein